MKKIASHVKCMKLNEVGYVVSWALGAVVKGDTINWYINSDHPVYKDKGGTISIEIERTADGYRASIPARDNWGDTYEWQLNAADGGFYDTPITVSSCNLEIRHDNGQVAYEKDDYGTESWYNENGRCTHCRNSNGFEYWWEYDDNGNRTHCRNSYGFERWWGYDANGNEIHYRNSNGYEYWMEYDAKGNCIHYRNSNGSEEWWEYDANGNQIPKPNPKPKMKSDTSHAIADALVSEAIEYIEEHPRYAETMGKLFEDFLEEKVGEIKELELPSMLFDRVRLTKCEI